MRPTSAKPCRVRFLEGYNGRDMLDFDLYLSPHDVWTAAISQTADDGGGALKTSDVSCTFPIIPSGGVALRTAAYDGTASGSCRRRTARHHAHARGLFRADHARRRRPGQRACRTDHACRWRSARLRLDPTTPPLRRASSRRPTASTARPRSSTSAKARSSRITPMRSGLQRRSAVLSRHAVCPSLQDANSSGAVNGVATAYVSTESGVPIALDYAFGIDAVSAIFMADTLYNEYSSPPRSARTPTGS